MSRAIFGFSSTCFVQPLFWGVVILSIAYGFIEKDVCFPIG